MKLIVGLGNPGAQYARNRHNVGFMVVDAIAEAQAAPWRAKFQGRIAEARFATGRVLLLKPETFMNLSGDSVRTAMAFHKLAPTDVIVLHDEIDLPPGAVRAKTGGGHAGHNGLRSIATLIGPDFLRVRLGVGHPGDKRLVSNYVLGDFAKADAEWLEPLIEAAAGAAPDLAAGDAVRFAAALARAAKPAVPPTPKAAPSAPNAAATPAPPAEPDPARGPLQRLVDRFR